MIHHRHYTVDEANAKLDLVGRIVRRIRDACRRLAADGFNSEFASLAEVSGGAYPGRDGPGHTELEPHLPLEAAQAPVERAPRRRLLPPYRPRPNR